MLWAIHVAIQDCKPSMPEAAAVEIVLACGRVFGTRRSLRSLPTQTILWWCDSVKCVSVYNTDGWIRITRLGVYRPSPENETLKKVLGETKGVRRMFSLKFSYETFCCYKNFWFLFVLVYTLNHKLRKHSSSGLSLEIMNYCPVLLSVYRQNFMF